MPKSKKSSGSPAGETVYLAVGFLRRPHGVHGEIIMDLHTDFPERLTSGRTYFVGESHRPVSLAGMREHGGGMLVRFAGIHTPEDAGLFRNQWLFVKTADVPPLPEGQVYQHQLLGVRVVDEHGAELGELTDIIETGANDVYVVTSAAGRELLLPAIPDVVLEVDVARGSMRVHLLEGLLPDEGRQDKPE